MGRRGQHGGGARAKEGDCRENVSGDVEAGDERGAVDGASRRLQARWHGAHARRAEKRREVEYGQNGDQSEAHRRKGESARRVRAHESAFEPWRARDEQQRQQPGAGGCRQQLGWHAPHAILTL